MSLNIVLHSRVVVALFFFVLLATGLSGQQEVWTIDQFLDIGLGDRSLPYQENLNFLNNKAKGMPFVDRYEFRTETDEMEFEQQQYQFRFQFNSSDERKAYNRILSANKDKYSWLQAQYQLEFWEEKYNNIIDLYFIQREMKLIVQDLEVLTDKKKVLRKLLQNNSAIDVEKWLSNEAEIFNVRSDSLEMELQQKEMAQRIFGSDRTLPKLDETNFISVASIKQWVTEVLSKEIQHPEDGLAIAEEKLADAEFKLEEAEANRWLEFAQIQYQSDNKLSFQREISIGTSIMIPHKNNNRVKKNEAALELLERRYKTDIKQEENKRGIFLEKAKLIGLINQYEAFEEMKKTQNLESSFDSFVENKNVSPLILIGIQRSIIKNGKKQLSLEKDIYESYIDLLTRNAMFLAEPRVNYLKGRD